MKPFQTLLLAFALALSPVLLPAQTNSNGNANNAANAIDISIKASGSGNTEVKEPPLFFSAKATSKTAITTEPGKAAKPASADQTGMIYATTVISTTISVLQGQAKVLSLDLDGPGEIISISGPNLATWSVRQPVPNPKAKTTNTRRHLDLRPPAKSPVKEFPVTITLLQKIPETATGIRLPTLGPGKAVGFTHQLQVNAPAELALNVTKQDGLSRQDNPALATTATAPPAKNELRFHCIANSHLAVSFTARNRYLGLTTFRNMKLDGTVEAETGSAAMQLTGEIIVPASPSPTLIDLLAGDAAITTIPTFAAGPSNASQIAHIRLHPAAGKVPATYKLHVEPGATSRTIPIDLAFDAKLIRTGAQRALSFRVPAGAVVPLTLKGVAETVELDRKQSVVPRWKGEAWQGFLPADGWCRLAWKPERTTEEGTLFYTSSASVDVKVAPGILRQSSDINLKILQGELNTITLTVEGDGEILNVTGAQVVGWKLNDEADGKTLTINMSRPIESAGQLRITSQTPIGDFPVTANPLRLIPADAVRHSGALRVSNIGAVRLGITDIVGLTQLAPEQFAGAKLAPSARQIFVYRFPSATHAYTITADAVLPEVAVSQITRVEFGETDRIIRANLEVDVREAPIREFDLTIPTGYSVASVQGGQVADHVLETDTGALQIIFGGAVQGRLLVQLRLERTAAAEAGLWQLPVLSFADAKTIRGHLGVSTTPGYRVTTSSLEGLTEIPLSTFPMRDETLQQAYRIRSANTAAELVVEALGQHVEVDTFHLYSLKEGVAYGSVLLNYFVVGAPVQQWRLTIPENLGHVAIDGQDVRAWQRQGETVTVDLNQPALGAQTLLVTFEQPMPSRNSTLVPATIVPLDVQGENGIIQVTSPQQLKHTWSGVSSSLLELDALELPAEFQLMSRSPSLGIYQYTERPFKLGLEIEWLEPGQTVEQLVDVAELSSLVSRDGDAVTLARYFVKTRGRKSLRLKLPEDLDLWEVRVAGKTVSPRTNDGDTIIKLPPNVDPNTAVDVAMRFGTTPGSVSRPRLQAPRLSPSTLFARWHVETEPGHHLIVDRGATVLQRVLPRSGFDMLHDMLRGVAEPTTTRPTTTTATTMTTTSGGIWWFVGALVLGLILRLWRSRVAMVLSALLLIGAIIGSVVLGFRAMDHKQPVLSQIDAVSSIIADGQTFELPARHVTTLSAHYSTPGILLMVVGLLLLVLPFFGIGKLPRLFRLLGCVAIGIGLLMQRGGAGPFFFLLAAFLFLLLGWRDLLDGFRWFLKMAKRRPKNAAGVAVETETATVAPPIAGGTALLFLLLSLPFMTPSTVEAADASPSADAIRQTAIIEDNRLYSDLTFQVSGKAGTAIPLLSAPAILAQFEADGLSLHKSAEEGGSYLVVLDAEGTYTGNASYELAIPELGAGFTLPTGPATVNTLELSIPDAGWEFRSAVAVRLEQGEAADASSATLVFGPQHALRAPAKIAIQPRARDLDAEAARVYAETSNLFIPGPGVVDSRHKVEIRPSQGRVSKLAFTMPDGFTVSDVTGPVGLWQFDPGTRSLRLNIEPAQSAPFAIVVAAQRGAEGLPVTLELRPLIVQDAAGDVGKIGLAFGDAARAQNVETEGLSPVNIEDFDAALISRGTILRRVFRYADAATAAADSPLTVTVGPVLPEVRAVWQQRLSIAGERTVLAADLTAQILRAGIFKLSLPIPEGFDVETASGPALAQWSEIEEDGTDVLRLDLNGRTIGAQNFAVTLVSTGLGSRVSWPVPRLGLTEAKRETGTLFVIPERGIRLRPVARSNVSLLDARAAGVPQAGAHAFKLLQADWSLVLDIEELDPWITAKALHEITLREGRTHTRIGVNFDVENATVKSLRLKLPNLGPEERDSVRATGDALATIVRLDDVDGADDTWELQFRRRMIGTVPVMIEYHRTGSPTNALASLSIIQLPEVRQLESHFAVHTAGRLDARLPDELPAGWRRADWTTIPHSLRKNARNFTPEICLRVAEPDGPLAFRVTRDDLADILKLHVTSSKLLTVFSHTGNTITSVDMNIRVVEKSTLRIRLPKGATLYNAFVNGESVSIINEDETFLFHVVSNPFNDGPARVSFVYAIPGKNEKAINDLALIAPKLPIPLENMDWQVVVPEGMRLSSHRGDLEHKGVRKVQVSNLQTYLAQLRERDARRSANARNLLSTANQYLQQGNREKALRMLDNIAWSKDLDPASNEDARVQLRELQTEQAWLGLNTRRQRLVLDRPESGGRDERLAEAARRNPLFQGKLNYRPDEISAFMSSNSAEENVALRRLAKRLTSHQLAAVPAPQAIAIDLPRQGQLHTFSRHVQVDGQLPLNLHLSLESASQSRTWFKVLTAFALGLICIPVLWFGRRRLSTGQ